MNLANRFIGAALAAMLTGSASAGPSFVDRAAEQPFQHVYDGGWEHFVGGGVAVFDCNDDHFPDLFAAGGDNPAKLLINRTGTAGGALAFEPIASDVTDLDHVTGAYPLDVDSDGFTDLFVLRVGENMLLRGLGGCRFSPAPDDWGFVSTPRWSTAFSATWEKGETFPTLAIGNYVDRSNPKGPFEACDANMLYRPHGQGFSAPAPLEPGYCALSMLFSDWGRKGAADLRISNDRHYYVRGGQEQLLRLRPTPEFYTEEDAWKPLSIWGMGIASRDISGDGLPEIFLTSMGDQMLVSLENGKTQPAYSAARYDRGLTAHRPHIGDEGRPSTGWHAEFGDIDNDGRDDLFIAKGNVNQMPDSAMRDPDNLLMQRPDGTFREAGAEAGVASFERGRGAGVVDLNRDGKLDIVVVNRRANIAIYENKTADTGNWLKIEARQPETNRAAVGAWIELKSGDRTWAREITIGGGHASGRTGFEHFGLGDANTISWRIIWPDGRSSNWQDSAANRHLIVKRTDGAPDIENF